MTAPIRPPSSPPPGLSGVDEAREAGPVGEGQVGEVSSRGVEQLAPAAGSEGPTVGWINRLQAGEITREQAIEGLVSEAMEAHGGARLSASHREQLADVLRAALAEDPVLARLLGP